MKKIYQYSMQNTSFTKRQVYQFFFPLFLLVTLFISNKALAMKDAMVVTEAEDQLYTQITSYGSLTWCEGNSMELGSYVVLNNENITEGLAYSWTGPNNFTSDKPTILITEAGTYTLEVKHLPTGLTATRSSEFKPIPRTAGSGGPDKKLTCDNPTVTLEGTSTSGFPTWYARDGGNIVSGYNTLNPVVDAPGTYVLVLNSPKSCSSEYTVKVTREDGLTASATGGTLYPSAPVQLKGSSSAEGATYSWTGPNGFTSTEQNPTVNVAGKYTLTVTDPETGCTVNAHAVVAVFSALIWVGKYTGEFDCDTSNTPYADLVGAAYYNTQDIREGLTFQWSGPNNFTDNKKVTRVYAPGTYTLLVTHIATGDTATASYTLASPKFPVGSAGPDRKLTCANPTVWLDGTVQVGERVIWLASDGGNIVSGADKLNPIVDAPGTYTMVVSFYDSSCKAEYTVKVTREDELTVSATGGKLDCASGSLQLMASSNTEGVTYSWTGPNGFTSSEQNPTVKVAGDYSVTVTNPESGCKATTSVVVTPVSTELQVSNHMIDFNGQKRGLISSINTEAGPVAIRGRKRNADGSYEPQNYAAIFDTQDPTADDANLYTVDWAEALIINQYHNDYPDANQWGGELILDFSAIGPVTMESFKVVGMDLYEQMSWVYLYDADGKELHKEYLKPLGINSKQTIDLGNTRGVVKMKVVMDGRNGSGHLSGSAAIDDIKFKVETTTENPCDVVAANITHMKAYPTSFSDNATLEFIVRDTDNYSINLYDTQGMLVKQLKQGTARAGELTTVELNGRELKEGMYFAKLVSGKTSHTFKLILKR